MKKNCNTCVWLYPGTHTVPLACRKCRNFIVHKLFSKNMYKSKDKYKLVFKDKR